eukprot:COSAG02_NODE_2190_length_9560_cov_4.988166_6_plen_433_part_00
MITSERLDLAEQHDSALGDADRDGGRQKADVLYINFDFGPKNVDVDIEFARVLHDRSTPDSALNALRTGIDDYRLDQKIQQYAKFREELDTVSGLFQFQSSTGGTPCWIQVTSQVLQRKKAHMNLFDQTRNLLSTSDDLDHLANPWKLEWDSQELGLLDGISDWRPPGSHQGRWVLRNRTLSGYLEDLTNVYSAQHAPLGRTTLEWHWKWLHDPESSIPVPESSIPVSIVEFLDLPRPPQHFGEMEMMELGSCSNPRVRDATATATVTSHMSKLSHDSYLELREMFSREMTLNEEYFKAQQQQRMSVRGRKEKSGDGARGQGTHAFKAGDRVRVNRENSTRHHGALAVIVDPTWAGGRAKVKMDKDGDTRYYSREHLVFVSESAMPAPATDDTSGLRERVENMHAEMVEIKGLLVKVLEQQEVLLQVQGKSG